MRWSTSMNLWLRGAACSFVKPCPIISLAPRGGAGPGVRGDSVSLPVLAPLLERLDPVVAFEALRFLDLRLLLRLRGRPPRLLHCDGAAGRKPRRERRQHDDVPQRACPLHPFPPWLR